MSKFIFKGFSACGHYSDSVAIRGAVFRSEDDDDAFEHGRSTFSELDGKHSETTGDYVTYTDIESILDVIFDPDYENYPDEMINYKWGKENPEKLEEILKLNEDLREKCKIVTTKKYVIADEFKED